MLFDQNFLGTSIENDLPTDLDCHTLPIFDNIASAVQFPDGGCIVLYLDSACIPGSIKIPSNLPDFSTYGVDNQVSAYKSCDAFFSLHDGTNYGGNKILFYFFTIQGV